MKSNDAIAAVERVCRAVWDRPGIPVLCADIQRAIRIADRQSCAHEFHADDGVFYCDHCGWAKDACQEKKQ